MRITIELYENTGGVQWPNTTIGVKAPTHRGIRIGMARHSKCAPFACVGTLRLGIEWNAFMSGELVTERCQECGRILNVWPVLPENNDAEDDGA